MTAALTARAFDRHRLVPVADWLAVAVAVSLPWSTSATGVLLVLWLVAALPTFDVAGLRRELFTAAGGLPVLLWLLAALGMLWADVTWTDALHGLGAFHKLLFIPLFLVAFRRSDAGSRVVAGFLVSCVALLVLSLAFSLWPGLAWRWIQPGLPGVPVKDYIAQAGEFVLCAFALGHLALSAWQGGRRVIALALAALAVMFLADVAYIVTSRTALVVVPFLLLLFGLQRLGWRGTVAIVAAGAALGAIVWFSSPNLRERVTHLQREIMLYETGTRLSSAGLRLAFWKTSLELVGEAPLIGHGTGTTEKLFDRAMIGKTGVDAATTINPHNQTFAVAIQIGLIGAALLWAMWIAHFLLFRGGGLMGWIGMGLVTNTVISSLFNSHIRDFTQGWIYVVGVGVIGGMVLRARAGEQARHRSPGGL